MMVLQDDGREQVRRCLQAMAETADLETRQSLWRCAVRFSRKGGEERARLEIHDTPLPFAAGGSSEWNW